MTAAHDAILVPSFEKGRETFSEISWLNLTCKCVGMICVHNSIFWLFLYGSLFTLKCQNSKETAPIISSVQRGKVNHDINALKLRVGVLGNHRVRL